MENLQAVLDELLESYRDLSIGEPASYIPELAKANPNDFAICVMTVDGKIFSAGNTDKTFTLQSVSKPFSYGLALEENGRQKVLSKVGVEPTGEAFNSIVELEKHTHRPYNPMINSGAIAITSLIKGKDLQDRLSKTLRLFEKYLGHPAHLDENVFQSERTTAHRNRSIAHLLRHFDIITEDIDETLDLYFGQCSVLANTKDLSAMAATLANNGVQPITKEVALNAEYVGDLLSLMFTCGMYDTSGEWAYNVGIPAKSGVSGGILGVVPGKMGIAVYSPPIDKQGHSVRGVRVFRELSRRLGLSIFRC